MEKSCAGIYKMKKSPNNMSRIICVMTIIAVLLFGAINVKVYAREPGKDQKKIYVSTVGMPFFVKNDVQYSNNDFIMYRIEAIKQRDKLLSELLNIIEISDRNETQYNMLGRVLSLIKYKKEHAYVILSPIKKDIRIEQPYHYKGENKLIFDTATKSTGRSHHLYLRTYAVDKANDRYKKMINIDGKLLELSLTEL